MITVTKADASVIKSSTILSAYIVSGGLDVMPAMTEILTDDMTALEQLEETELVCKAKALVKLAIEYNKAPSDFTQSCAKRALDELADLLIVTKEQ